MDIQNNKIENTNNDSYFKKWAISNPEKLKQSRLNWYNANKNNEEFKAKRKAYNALYYQKRKNEKTILQNE